MAKQCIICNKGSLVAGGYSNRIRATQFNPTGKRRKNPNLQWVRDAKGARMKVCTVCIRGNKHLAVS
ncbi:50S ribosomal protein L28 [bacterium]|nr:50S ribosomal protein L28 [bacterium]